MGSNSSSTNSSSSSSSLASSSASITWNHLFAPRASSSSAVSKVSPLVPRSKQAQPITAHLEEILKHSKELCGVGWRSKSRNYYEDPYYPCCGVRKGRNGCLRSLWPDPSAVHSGDLKIQEGSRKRGAGNSQYGDLSHIPRGSTPYWTCCLKTATAPGCSRSSVQGMGGRYSQEAYNQQVRKWMEEWDGVIHQEQIVRVHPGGTAVTDNVSALRAQSTSSSCSTIGKYVEGHGMRRVKKISLEEVIRALES
eukprot:GILI01012603.1.p1 GENE.GILI01012603.1~~GILI01012603.1.p1  ORF type:complete len:277 (-),score=13.20 GILI01012603.1:145-897(-)